MNKIVRVGAVSYLNTKPLLYGFTNGRKIDNMQLVTDYPSSIAEKLLNDEIDVGLVPVAIIPKMKEHHIITDCCIGAEGPVASVCIFSEVPIDKIETLLLDYQSRTSVALARILISRYWQINPVIEAGGTDLENKVSGTTAAVIIGDRALQQRHRSTYIFDLAEAWKDFTGLPFVFAAWIANKQLPAAFIDAFSRANTSGLHSIDEVVAQNPYSFYDLRKYFTQNISYTLTAEKRKGLETFLAMLP